jgi:hypothetical protein
MRYLGRGSDRAKLLAPKTKVSGTGRGCRRADQAAKLREIVARGARRDLGSVLQGTRLLGFPEDASRQALTIKPEGNGDQMSDPVCSF